MAVERKRGCGYRKVGGVYLVAGGISEPCHRLPFPLQVCPVCKSGIKQARGWTWIEPGPMFGRCETESSHCITCAACMPPVGEHGLMWVGAKFYTPESFTLEAKTMGVSKRIAAVPNNLRLGETWVYLAHPEAAPLEDGDRGPGIFTVFKPTRIELIITQSQYDAMDADERAKKESRGYRYVVVPDDDPDHNPNAKGEADILEENGLETEVGHET